MSHTVGNELDERVWKVPLTANAFAEAKKFTELALVTHGLRCREATTMAVWELAENVIKYGEPDRRGSMGAIGINVRNGVIRIRATSVATSPQRAQIAVDTIARISTVPRIGDLYQSRLRELSEDPAQQHTRLGLLRVAFEGGFRLSCRYQPPHFEIIAEGNCERMKS